MNASINKFPDHLDGEFISLLKMGEEDTSRTYKWRTSKVAEHLNQPVGYSLDMQKRWILSRPDTEINYIIHRRDTQEAIGMIAILDLNWDDMVGSVGRLLLDEKYVRKGTPYGLEALLITYRYVFEELNFRKITGVVLARNKKVVELQKYLGMEEEGYLTRHVLLNGQEEDEVILSLFKEDFVRYNAMIASILYKYR